MQQFTRLIEGASAKEGELSPEQLQGGFQLRNAKYQKVGVKWGAETREIDGIIKVVPHLTPCLYLVQNS